MRPASSFRAAPGGFSLIDVLLVIVMLAIIGTGLTTVSARLAAESAQTMKTRQAMAVAQALLEEIRHMPFTYCDANDAQAATATSATLGATGCQASVDAMGPEPGESRYSAVNRFDSVTDYQGFTMPGPGCAGLCDMAGLPIYNGNTTLVGCTASVSLTPQALAAIAALDANGRPQVLRIAVSVSCPGLAPLVAEAVRVRHAPTWF